MFEDKFAVTLAIELEVRHALHIVLVDQPQLLGDAVAFIDVQDAGWLAVGGLTA